MIYPSEFTNPREDDSHGKASREEEFYYRFRDEIKSPGVVFYNLILKLPGVNHREIDFLYICPSGIFTIELKNAEYRNNESTWPRRDSTLRQNTRCPLAWWSFHSALERWQKHAQARVRLAREIYS